MVATSVDTGSRTRAARRRARLAKAVFALGAALSFVVAAVLARASFAGRPRAHTHSLSAPSRFVRIVRENQLQAGAIAPPQAPPAVSSSSS